MGILLTFMFLWNMLGALVLIPALSYFLLRKTSLPQRVAMAEPTAQAAVVPVSAAERRQALTTTE
ncbi:hypothetical protein D9M71_504520 [compost metagenome]